MDLNQFKPGSEPLVGPVRGAKSIRIIDDFAFTSGPSPEEVVKAARDLPPKRLPKTAPRRFVPPSGKGSPEWYTPAYIIEAAREVMGGIDCDPASCAIAQETVKASVYYTKEDDGLTKPWHGRVWLNPPYTRYLVSEFYTRLICDILDGRVQQAVTLANCMTYAAHFQQLMISCQAACFPLQAVKFKTPESHLTIKSIWGSVAFHYGPNTDRFAQVFSQFGAIAVPYQPQ